MPVSNRILTIRISRTGYGVVLAAAINAFISSRVKGTIASGRSIGAAIFAMMSKGDSRSITTQLKSALSILCQVAIVPDDTARFAAGLPHRPPGGIDAEYCRNFRMQKVSTVSISNCAQNQKNLTRNSLRLWIVRLLCWRISQSSIQPSENRFSVLRLISSDDKGGCVETLRRMTEGGSVLFNFSLRKFIFGYC